MLIRFKVSNFYSFKEPVEFNMLTGATRRLEHHVYKPAKGLELLKMAAIYGANGAGKSNLAKAMFFLQNLLKNGWTSPGLFQFKLNPANALEPTSMEIELALHGKTFLYGVDIFPNYIAEEWLYQTQPEKADQIIFHRFTNSEGTTIRVAPELQQSDEQKLRIKLYETELLEPTELFLRIASQSKADFGMSHSVAEWLRHFWKVFFPHSSTKGIIWDMVFAPGFLEFAQELMCSTHTGIASLELETLTLEQFFGKDEIRIDKIKNELESSDQPEAHRIIETNPLNTLDAVIAVKENGEIVIKRLIARQKGAKPETAPFQMWQQSDGTLRLLELSLLFFRAIYADVTIVIDEIDQTIHPLLLKNLITKFSQEKATKGQLIFTTHEAHLLDQEIMRQDEFWFVDKNEEGATQLSPLSDFKDIRYDLDLRKGYLSGRFGAIPAVGTLRHLNWNRYAEAK